MIKQVEITGEYGDSVTIKLANPINRDGDIPEGVDVIADEYYANIFITEIEGLGPAKADLQMAEIATQHGSIYNSSRVKSREITFHLLFLDNVSWVNAEDARQQTYKLFPIGRKVTLTIKTGNRSVRTTGYVEENEPDIFAEQVGSKITVSCPSPWFNVTGPAGTQTIEFSNLSSEFEFPAYYEEETKQYEHELMDEPTPSFIFSSIVHNAHHEIVYNGEVENGMLISFIAYDKFKNPTVYDIDTGKKMKISTDKIEKFLRDNDLDLEEIIDIDHPDQSITVHTGIQPGDVIRVNTVENNKYVRFYKYGGSQYWNVMNAISDDSDWLTLRPGYNTIGYSCESGEYDVTISLEAKVLLQGV